MENFTQTEAHKRAQKYELQSNNGYANTDSRYINLSKDLLSRIDNYRNNQKLEMFDKFGSLDNSKQDVWLHDFFNDSEQQFIEFSEKMKSKNNLEIGSGPCGFLNHMFWLENRNIIEPLLNGYKENQFNLYKKSWFDDKGLNCFSQPAEILIPDLIGKIDGFVVCRNCLDHTQDWKQILQNIAQYTVKDSMFLLWTDLYHIHGSDEGHFNITDDKEYFRKYMKDIGFEIQQEFEYPKERGCLDIGAIMQKTI